MDLKEFYKGIKGIVLFPGSVDELNILEEINSSDREYKLMPIKGDKKYLIGTIIPNLKEIEEQVNNLKEGIRIRVKAISAIGGLETSLAQEIGREAFKELGPIGNIVESLYTENIKNPAFLGMDIRLKAKEIGANGLVHVQVYDKESFYMGVPVKLSKMRSGDL